MKKSSPNSEREDEALRLVVEGTVSETGTEFYRALVRNLAKALGTAGAWVTEFDPVARHLRALAFWLNGQYLPSYEHAVDGTPCQIVIDTKSLAHFPERVIELYPNDPDLRALKAVSYLGVPLFDTGGDIMGHLAILDTKPLPPEPRMLSLFNIFAARAAAELRRLRAEQRVRAREEKLTRLLDSAMDAVIEFDSGLRITMLNPAAKRVFGCQNDGLVGTDFGLCLEASSRAKLAELVRRMDELPEGERSLWIAGGLEARPAQGGAFPAEATLSRYDAQGRPYHSLILRNVNERKQAEQKIQSLAAEASYLREELSALQNFGEIVGQSAALRRALQDVRQVADTDASVLVLGETGTGKELFARAIHAASRRREQPLIKVNCAAIPAALIESEFFGHEKGAFTGATARREGRFALADGGTLFLDEVGELPLDLQGKLLRVLQEGEFELVGSSTTRKVNVRVVAATNRDLECQAKEGKFREDLFYRLNVFPIRIPPLRERDEDVVLLATAFAQRFANRMGRAVRPPSDDDARRLKSYAWPGNVRELANVIERAVITAVGGRLNLDRALPDAARDTAPQAPAALADDRGGIRTMRELEELERANLRRALEACQWRVAGGNGAASLLGMNPSTLNSRMKALGLKRPM